MTHTAQGIDVLVHLLLIEQRGIDPTAVRPEHWSEPVRGWLSAAAALAAGEPRRALALLGKPVQELTYDDLVTRTLRTAAVAMDVNWSPGGLIGWAVPPEDEAVLLQALDGTHARVAILAKDPRLRLAAFLAGRCLPDLFSARAVLGNAAVIAAHPAEVAQLVGWTEVVEEAHDVEGWFDSLPQEIAEGGLAIPAAYHLLVAADVRVRAGDHARGELLRRDALRRVPGSPAVAGMAALLAGDSVIGPPGAAERCSPVHAGRKALTQAERHYAEAKARFREAGAARGQAAAALRIAHTARLRHRPEACTASLDQALALAETAGDGACAALLKVHRALDLIAAGRPLLSHDVESVHRWASTVGSGSWLRGMADLVTARASAWSGRGDIVRSREAGGLAERLAHRRGTAEVCS